MPATFSSARQFVGFALETTPGTPVAPTFTYPVEKCEPETKVTWLEDKGMRGSMVSEYGLVQGVKAEDLSISGAVFGDGLGFMLANLFGDVVVQGTPTAPTGTLSAAVTTVGATSVSSSVSIPNGTTIQIDTGTLAEIVTTTGAPTGAGPYTIPVTALKFTHLTGVAITAIAAPYTSAFATLNNGASQPKTNTISHYQGPVATTGARQFPGACCSELTLKWVNESALFTFDSKWTAWPSVPAGATPTAAPTTVTPQASWRSQLGIGGPASGGTLVTTVQEGEITFKRELQVIYTGNLLQTPYIIQRGPVSANAKLTFVAADESPLTTMLSNTQPQLQFILGNGLAGASLVQAQIDAAAYAYRTSKYSAGKAAVEYQVEGDFIANTTNVGWSAGYSPAKVTLSNAITAGTYQ